MNEQHEDLVADLGGLVLNAIGLGAVLGLGTAYFREQPQTWNYLLIYWTGSAVFGGLLAMQLLVAARKFIRLLSENLHRMPPWAIYLFAGAFTLATFSTILFLAAALSRTVLAEIGLG